MKKLLFLFLVLGVAGAQSQVVLDTVRHDDNWYRAWSLRINPNFRVVADSLNFFLSLAHQMGANSGWRDQGTYVGLGTPTDSVLVGSGAVTDKFNVYGTVGVSDTLKAPIVWAKVGGIKFPDGTIQVTAVNGKGIPDFPNDTTEFLRGDSTWAVINTNIPIISGDAITDSLNNAARTLTHPLTIGTLGTTGTLTLEGNLGGIATITPQVSGNFDYTLPAASGIFGFDSYMGGYHYDLSGISGGKMWVFDGPSNSFKLLDTSVVSHGGVGGSGRVNELVNQ